MVIGSIKSYGGDTQCKIKHTTLTSSISKEYSLVTMMVCDGKCNKK